MEKKENSHREFGKDFESLMFAHTIGAGASFCRAGKSATLCANFVASNRWRPHTGVTGRGYDLVLRLRYFAAR